LVGRDFWAAQVYVEQTSARLLPEVSADDLRLAWLEVVRRAKLKTNHKLGRAELSVREHMSMVLRRLGGQKFVEFQDLFSECILPVVVVHFLALLELAREGLVDITQAAAYAPIYVRLSFTPMASSAA
jgi:segregation and condensation protein A